MSAVPARPAAPSLRRQLMAPLVWVWGLGTLAAGLAAYWIASASANAAFDRGLQDEASALAARISWTDRGPLLDVSRQAMELISWDSTERNSFVVLDDKGRVMAGDAQVPRPDVRHHSFAKPLLFEAEDREGEPLRGAMFSVASPMLDRSVSIVVVETLHKRRRLVRDVLLALALPLLAVGGLSLALLAWGIRRGLQPLREVAREAARRAASDLRPLPLEGVPREALPLIERINQLLAEVQAAVALQRRFVADAAHQLRTPVAGLRVLTQELALELHGSPEQVQPLVQALLNSTERMSRLIGQLLALTRSGAALGQLGEAALQDIRPLLREAAEPLALRAAREGRNLWLELPEQPVLARAHPLWLGEALANVLDNALRYGGPNIRVRVQDGAGGVSVSICDDGPGVAPQDLPRLCEPFWRGERADTRAQDGTGLGLAIAHEIITRLGGRWQAQTRPEVAGFVIRWELAR